MELKVWRFKVLILNVLYVILGGYKCEVGYDLII